MNISITQIKDKANAIISAVDGIKSLVIGKVGDDAISISNAEQYPIAVSLPTSIRSNQPHTNQENDRVYTLGYAIVFNNSNDEVTYTDIDELVEDIMDTFDDKITLDGINDTGNVWVEPSSTRPYFFGANNAFCAVDIVLQVHVIRGFEFGNQ